MKPIHFQKPRVFFSLFIFVTLFLPQFCLATTVIVDAGGGGDYLTLQEAVNNASPGDTLQVNAGTYTESVDLDNMGSAIGGGIGDLYLLANDTVLIDGGAGQCIENSVAYTGDLTIAGFSFTRSGSTGGAIELNNITGTVSIFNNTWMSTTMGDNMEIDINDITTHTILIIDGNTSYSGTNYDMLDLNVGSTAVCNLTFNNNFMTGTRDDMVDAKAIDSATFFASFTNNTFTSALGLGSFLDLVMGGVSSLNVKANLYIDGNYTFDTDGVVITVETSGDSTQLDAIISNNTLNECNGNGIGIQLRTQSPTDGGTINVMIEGNSITNAESDGIKCYFPDPGPEVNVLNLVIKDNLITNPNETVGAAGIYVLTSTFGATANHYFDATVKIVGNEVVGNPSHAYWVDNYEEGIFCLHGTGIDSAQAQVESDNIGSPVLVFGPIPECTLDGSLIPATIGNRVWHDLNANGIQDGGEPGIGGVLITLTGDESRTTLSAPDGSYAFPAVKPGTYTLHFAPPAGFGVSSPQDAGPDSLDSDIDTAGMISTFVLLPDAGSDTTRDAGFLSIGSISCVPGPAIDLGPDVLICSGDTLVVDAGAGFFSYNWNGGTATQTLAIDLPGAYSVIVTDSIGCTAADTLVVDTLPLPTPTIIDGGTTLSSSIVGVSYQWYAFGTPIPGATHDTLNPSTNGDYSVEVTDANGCVGHSAPLSFLVGMEAGMAPFSFQVMPNPTTGTIHISYSQGQLPDDLQLSMFDLLGKEITPVILAQSSQTIQLDLGECSPGIYLLKFQRQGRLNSVKVMVE